MEATVNKRVLYLDIARGIGILLVVLGHCTAIPQWLNHCIFTVHMPLFFILSGYTFNSKKTQDFKSFALKNCKTLLLPYGLTAGAILLLQVLKAWKNHEDIWNVFVKWLITGLYGSGTKFPDFFMKHGIPITYIGAIWFLLALFFARLLLFLILRSRTPLFWAVACFFIGYVSAIKIGWFPFSIQAGFCAVLFLYVGYLIKENDLLQFSSTHWLLKVLMLGIWIYCCVFCGRLWMVSNTYSDGFLDIIGGISGTFVLVYLAQALEKIPLLQKIFSWLGTASLGIMCAHVIVLDCLTIPHYAELFMRFLSVSYMLGEIITVFLASAIVTLVLYVLPWINRKMFPARFVYK